MAIELNHTIVPAHDPQASAQFLADILGLTVDPPVAHFTPVTPANGVSLDFDHYDHVDEHHYAFQLGEEEFEAAFARIRDNGLSYYADPGCRQPGQVYAGKNGRRGTYFRDPNGHLMEILTPVEGDPRAVATAYFAAWKAHDPVALRALLADDATFSGPLGTAGNADEMAESIQGLFAITTDVVIAQMAVQDGDVLTWFDLHTTVAAPTAVVNWSQVREGKILSVRATFDPRPIIAGS